jgi:sterol desaturase/sphingolipid hydroxylase (fatty acid hydroxylase superfamily)
MEPGITLFELSEPALRLGAFALIFGGMSLWEFCDPWRDARQGRVLRWPGNLGIFALDIVVARLLFPASAVGIAIWAQGQGFGLLPLLGLPALAAGIAGFTALDLVIYGQHIVFHKVPLLWRFHRMHHADTELDVTSGFRFHPVEILLSLAVKAIAIIVLGVPPLAVLIFEIVLNATSLYNHSNVRLAPRIERWLRFVIVTPEMHIIHHSAQRTETDSNFGFNLSLWDRLFGTFTAAPHAGYHGMVVGLETFRDVSEQRVDKLVTQPFREPR